MPELPEVETMRRGILGSVGGRITAVRRPRSHLRPIAIAPPLGQFRRRVLGKTIEAVGRIGKRVVLCLDSDDRIVFEPRMTGRILVGEPQNTAHLRLVLELHGSAIPHVMFWDVRGLGLVHLFSAERFLEELGPERIGPDALQITARELRGRLGASRRAIKVALLNQRAVSGIGNLYASEILYDAAIHPALPCNRIRPEQWLRLTSSVRRILEEAIRCQGSTLGDGTYRTALDESGGYQEHHRVYQRAGKPCVRCGSRVVVRLVQAQRSTFFCPGCQLR